MTNLIKINNKYTNNKLIYLDKDTYKIIKSLTKDIKKVFNDEIIITGGYKTLFIIKRNSYHQLYNSGKAFNLLIKNKEILNYINDNLAADKKNYVFIDEVQIIDKFPKAVDSLFIKKIVLFIILSLIYLYKL